MTRRMRGVYAKYDVDRELSKYARNGKLNIDYLAGCGISIRKVPDDELPDEATEAYEYDLPAELRDSLLQRLKKGLPPGPLETQENKCDRNKMV